MNPTRDGATLVVGAGLAGLVSATVWREKGEPVILVERASHTGGMARSIRQDGFIFDIGPHFIIRRTHWLDRLFAPGELIEFVPRIFMVIGDSWIPYPLGLRSLLHVPLSVQMDFLSTRLFGLKESDECGPPSSFRRNMSRIYGKELFEYFFRPYLTKKLGGSDLCEGLHSDWWSMSEHERGAVKRCPPATDSADSSGPLQALRKLSRLRKELPYVFMQQKLGYPHGGFGEIARRLTDGLVRSGAELRLNTEVTEIRRDERRILSAEVGGETVPVRRLIWTGSPVVLARALGIVPLSLPTLHVMVFFVTMDRRYPRRGTEVRPLSPDMAFYRGYFPEMISSELTPGGRSAVVAEVGTTDLSALERAGERYGAVADTCVELGLCPRSGITGISHVCVPHSYPLYTLDYEAHLQRFYKDLTPLENLILSGRNARFQYFNSHQVLMDGERTKEDRLF